MDLDVRSILSFKNQQKKSFNLSQGIKHSEFIEGPITVIVDGFGYLNNDEQSIVKRFTFLNQNHVSVQVITYGATITSMRVPNKCGYPEDIIMGFDNLDGYISDCQPGVGGTIGRVFDRIENDGYIWDTMDPLLSHHEYFQGPEKSFDKRNWEASLSKNILTMTLVSKNGEFGYPGTAMVRASFELKNNNSFCVSYAATVSFPTPINISNKVFFNLAGHGSGYNELYKHIVTINADKHLPIDEENIPTGQIQCIGGTAYDLRIPHELGPAIARCPSGGYDNYLVVTQGIDQNLTFVARIVHPNSGRVLEVYADQPGVHFSTANDFPDPMDDIHPREIFTQDYYEIPSTRKITKESECLKSKLPPIPNLETIPYECHEEDENTTEEHAEEEQSISCSCSIRSSCPCSSIRDPIKGKCGAEYMKHGAFCLSTAKYPDALNHENFPTTIIYPGQMYQHKIVYNFGLHMGFNKKLTCPSEDVDDEHEMEDEDQL